MAGGWWLVAGGWWLGAYNAGYSDKSVSLLRIDGSNRLPRQLPRAVGGDGPLDRRGRRQGVTADLRGAAAHVEGRFDDDAFAMLVTGAAGDHSPTMAAETMVADAALNHRAFIEGHAL